MTEPQPRRMSRGPLTSEIKDASSPVRQFLDSRFAAGLRDVQHRYRASGGGHPLTVPGAAQDGANPGTVGTAADWLLRFMLHPRPSLRLAAMGAVLCGRTGGPADANLDMVKALGKVAATLGLSRADVTGKAGPDFTGPVPGCAAEPEHLARCCWLLALLTEVFRGGPRVLAGSPLGQLPPGEVSADRLLALCPPGGLDQLAQFRDVFAARLLPQLAARPGLWALGPTFTGSELIKADADLIAGGLLADLKTSAKFSLSAHDLYQVVGYALLDFDDEFRLAEVGIFSARYAHLATWPLGTLLDELAGHEISLKATRNAFRELLAAEYA